jgi:mannose-1-phosphate guanylyltransferase
MATSDHSRWSIILAGGDGRRLRAMSRRIEGDDRPKQFCRVLGAEPLLQQTRRRSEVLVPPANTLLALTRRHERFYRSLVAGVPAEQLVVQPDNRGTAPAVLWSLLRVAATAPLASVVILPSDHYVSDDRAFMAHVARAFETVGARPDLVVLLGIVPTRPEPEFGWIEAGPPVVAGRWPGLSRVLAFREKPSRAVAEALLAAGALWNSFVIVARVPALLSMIRQAQPRLWRAFRGAANTGAEGLYASLMPTSLSEAVLARGFANLAVLEVTGVEWNDLGDPVRVIATLAGAGLHPAWARAAAGRA